MQTGRCGQRVVSPPRRWPRGLAACAVAVLMAACATRAPALAPEPRIEAPPPPPAGGRVLGRSERFVIYQPATGDTLR